MAVCLVTGGAGFIGSHLVDALVARQHTVRVLDDFSTGTLANLGAVKDKIGIISGDLSDLDLVRQAVLGVDLVFHQGALASVPRSVADPLATHQACATGTLNVLLASREANVRRVIYAASSSAYGNSPKLPKTEADPTQPLSPYAVAKLAGEHYCSVYSYLHGLETVRLRYFNVFGPRQRADSPYAAVIPRFLEAMLAGKSPTIYGDGLQSRDFTYVEDAVQANLLAAVAPRVSGNVYNIAFGRRTTLLDIVRTLNRLLGTNIQPIHAKPRAGDVRHSLADISRAKAGLGYCPSIDVERGLRLILEDCSADSASLSVNSAQRRQRTQRRENSAEGAEA